MMTEMRTVDAATLKAWLESGEAVLVDVREPMEHGESSIAGAKSIPLGGISAQALPNCEGKKLVMQCGGGGRSAKACQKLLSELPTLEVYNLEGGIRGWIGSGYPVRRAVERVVLLQQVEILAGIVIFLGMLLGSIHSSFYFIVYLTALCLVLSGMTGVCYVARFLSRLPWNRERGISSCPGGVCLLKRGGGEAAYCGLKK